MKASRDRLSAVSQMFPRSLPACCPMQMPGRCSNVAEHVVVAERGMFADRLDRSRNRTEAGPFDRNSILKHGARPQRQSARSGAGAAQRQCSTLGRRSTHSRQARGDHRLHGKAGRRGPSKNSGSSIPSATLDAYQLLLIMAIHAERHAEQIEESNTAPAYVAAAAKSIKGIHGRRTSTSTLRLMARKLRHRQARC